MGRKGRGAQRTFAKEAILISKESLQWNFPSFKVTIKIQRKISSPTKNSNRSLLEGELVRVSNLFGYDPGLTKKYILSSGVTWPGGAGNGQNLEAFE